MKALLRFYAPIKNDKGSYTCYEPGDEVNSDHIGEHKARLVSKGYIQVTEKKVAKKKPVAKKKTTKPKGAK